MPVLQRNGHLLVMVSIVYLQLGSFRELITAVATKRCRKAKLDAASYISGTNHQFPVLWLILRHGCGVITPGTASLGRAAFVSAIVIS